MCHRLFVLGIMLLLAVSAASAASSPKTFPYPNYANAAFSTFMSKLYDSKQHRLLFSAGNNKTSNYWNTAVALQGLLHYSNFVRPRDPKLASRVVGIVERLVQTQTTLNQSDPQLRNSYNDDMAWMIHGLTALYDHTRNRKYIDMATLLFDTIKQSDDTTCCGDMLGGVWWDLAHTQKATAAQAGVTMAALRLRETGAVKKYPASYLLQYAADHYAFWRQHMVNLTSGQVCDNINTQGVRNWWAFTYNNGLMLGDAVHLYKATQDKQYLADAKMFAGFLMQGQTVSINGTKKTIMRNDCDQCDGDSSQFHQVSFQYLTEYYRLLHQLGQPVDELYAFLQAHVDSLWINARNPQSGLFNCNWDAPFSKGVEGIQGAMNGAVSAFSLFSTLPLPRSGPHHRLE